MDQTSTQAMGNGEDELMEGAQQMMGQPNNMMGAEDETSQAELAKKLGSKIGRKLKIPQILISLNISEVQAGLLSKKFTTLFEMEK